MQAPAMVLMWTLQPLCKGPKSMHRPAGHRVCENGTEHKVKVTTESVTHGPTGGLGPKLGG